MIELPEVHKEKNYPPRVHFKPYGDWELEVIIPASPPKSVANIQFYRNNKSGRYEMEMKIREFMCELMNIPTKNGEVLWDILVDMWDIENPDFKFRNWSETEDECDFSIAVGNNGIYPPVAFIIDSEGKIDGSFEIPIKEPRTVEDITLIVKPSISLKELLQVLRGDDEYDIPVWKSLLVRWDSNNPESPVWNWEKFRIMYDTEYMTLK